MQQGSNEWFESRLGRFTGSEIHKLLGVKGLGATGETYCFEKAIEMVFGRDEEDNFESFDMMRGKQLEPVAFRKFKELKEMDFISVEEVGFFEMGENAGASPDGLVGSDAVLEIKCPRPNKFFNLVAKGIDAIDKEYIAQMNLEMMATKTKQCHFFNFIIFNGKPMWHEIVVTPDVNMVALINQRIEQAVIIRDKYMKDLMTNCQFER